MAYGTTTFSWDAAGRLIKIASGKGRGKRAISASYLYNGLGQRLIKGNPALVNPPHRFVFDPAGHLIGEYDKANSVRQETVWIDDIPVAVVKPGPPAASAWSTTSRPTTSTPRASFLTMLTPPKIAGSDKWNFS